MKHLKNGQKIKDGEINAIKPKDLNTIKTIKK